MQYTVIVYQAEEGEYWAKVPALPRCYSQGDTIGETMENIREAIDSHLIVLTEDNQKTPEEGSMVFCKVEVTV